MFPHQLTDTLSLDFFKDDDAPILFRNSPRHPERSEGSPVVWYS